LPPSRGRPLGGQADSASQAAAFANQTYSLNAWIIGSATAFPLSGPAIAYGSAVNEEARETKRDA
jgi:hypothetical protein